MPRLNEGRRLALAPDALAGRAQAALLPPCGEAVDPCDGVAQAEPDQHQQRRQRLVARGGHGQKGADIPYVGEVAMAEHGGRCDGEH